MQLLPLSVFFILLSIYTRIILALVDELSRLRGLMVILNRSLRVIKVFPLRQWLALQHLTVAVDAAVHTG
jgi:hypothetical protein